MNSGIWIPIIAILATFAVPIVAMVMDFKRRQLQAEERRAMIERGMEPPPLPERAMDFGQHRTLEQRRVAALSGGIVMLALGLGLGLGAFLVGNVVTNSFIPHRAVGPLALAACVIGFIGLGLLVFYAVAGKHGSGEGAAP